MPTPEEERDAREIANYVEHLKKQLGLGPTEDYPQGKLSPDDNGGTKIALGRFRGKIVLVLGTPITWLGFDSKSARALAAGLLQHANELDGIKNS